MPLSQRRTKGRREEEDRTTEKKKDDSHPSANTRSLAGDARKTTCRAENVFIRSPQSSPVEKSSSVVIFQFLTSIKKEAVSYENVLTRRLMKPLSAVK